MLNPIVLIMCFYTKDTLGLWQIEDITNSILCQEILHRRFWTQTYSDSADWDTDLSLAILYMTLQQTHNQNEDL